MVTFTSLVGARRYSIRPTPGNRPTQFEKRISRKNETKIGMYGFAASPAIELAKNPYLAYRGARAHCRREAGDFRGALEDYRAEPGQPSSIAIARTPSRC